MVKIIEYEDTHHSDFKRLNLHWLDKYNLTESHDLMVLDDPRGTIIDRGGYIWLAKDDDDIIGSAALMKKEHGEYELAKMAVTPEWQGMGISKMLLEICINKARDLGGRKVFLYSNHQLTRALQLYRNYGFKEVKPEGSPFKTADIKMELNL